MSQKLFFCFQVKELGVLGVKCPTLSQDLAKIFSVYWLVAESSKIPENWPQEVETEINATKPMELQSQIPYSAYLSVNTWSNYFFTYNYYNQIFLEFTTGIFNQVSNE